MGEMDEEGRAAWKAASRPASRTLKSHHFFPPHRFEPHGTEPDWRQEQRARGLHLQAPTGFTYQGKMERRNGWGQG